MSKSLVSSLIEALGIEAVDTSEGTLRSHARDRWPPAAKWTAEEEVTYFPVCVVRPSDEAAVIQAVRLANDAKQAIVPFGAGSGVCGAVVSTARPVVIDLREMNGILHFDPESCLLEVEAGAIAMDVEKWLNARQFTLGHYPQSMGLATIGGLVSTRSSGTFSGKYGNIEELVAGLDVVLASGELVRTPRTVRSATGPDIKQLFIGAEGTLGIVTRVALRVFPLPEARRFVGFTFPTIDSGIAAVRQAYARHVRPAVLRLYDSIEAASLYQRVGANENAPLLVVGHDGLAGIVEAEQRAFEAIATGVGARPLGPRIGEAWEQHRFDASWLEIGNAGPTKFADAIEVSAFWPRLVPLYHAIMERAGPLCERMMGHYSHFYGTGGALYIIFFVEGDSGADALARYEAVWREVLATTTAHGGSISHHHGIGRARAAALAAELGSGSSVLVALKQALDGANRLNPGHLSVQGAS